MAKSLCYNYYHDKYYCTYFTVYQDYKRRTFTKKGQIKNSLVMTQPVLTVLTSSQWVWLAIKPIAYAGNLQSDQKPQLYLCWRDRRGSIVTHRDLWWMDVVQRVERRAWHPDGHHTQYQARHKRWEGEDPSAHQAQATSQRRVGKGTQDAKHSWRPHNDSENGLRDSLSDSVGWEERNEKVFKSNRTMTSNACSNHLCYT